MALSFKSRLVVYGVFIVLSHGIFVYLYLTYRPDTSRAGTGERVNATVVSVRSASDANRLPCITVSFQQGDTKTTGTRCAADGSEAWQALGPGDAVPVLVRQVPHPTYGQVVEWELAGPAQAP